jgi:hypothetical protein
MIKKQIRARLSRGDHAESGAGDLLFVGSSEDYNEQYLLFCTREYNSLPNPIYVALAISRECGCDPRHLRTLSGSRPPLFRRFAPPRSAHRRQAVCFANRPLATLANDGLDA